ncbi:MAG: glycosyltransferase, partial [Candidatus Hydrogenedentes bacterium]|nr:glycosyltransferase [Candidatus Hydrogenedentota bacterium]
AILARERHDFEVWITHDDARINSDSVKAIGWRSHEDLHEVYAKSDICVVPSIWQEPFGMVAPEAMATGRPVVASKVGGLTTSVVDGETGFHVPPADPAALAVKLRVLLDDPSLRARMGRAGRARVEKQFTWDTVAKQYYPPLLDNDNILGSHAR